MESFQTFSFSPGAYRGKGGFRPVVRMSCNGKMRGNKSAPVLFATEAEAKRFAMLRAIEVATRLNLQNWNRCSYRVNN